MIELKLKCYSCDYERIVGKREYIEDLQHCSNCESDNIEILPIEDSPLEKENDLSVRKGVLRHRLNVIGVISIIILLLSMSFTLIVHPVIGIPLLVVGILCLVLASVISLCWS